MDSEMKKVMERVSSLKGARTWREGKWRELATWLCPWRGIFDPADNDRREETEALFTGAAAQAVLRGASGITGGMTPRNTSWFMPDFTDADLGEVMGARHWLDRLDLAMKDCLGAGGFYQAIQNFNIDLIWAGCGLLYSERSGDLPLRVECVQTGSYAVALDQNQRLQAVWRTLRLTCRDLENVFGRHNMSPAAVKKLEREPWDKVIVNHYVEAGPERVKSWWWEENHHDGFLRKSFYFEMPYFFTVWNEGPTVYGTGPGDDALADAKQLNYLETYKLECMDKLTHPPVVAHPQLKNNLNLQPNGITWAQENTRLSPIFDLGPTSQALNRIQEEINTVQQRLNATLMASIFTSMPLDQRPRDMSATEFLERKREALQQMGPVISAYEPNVLTPLLYRVMAALERDGALPMTPQALQDFALPMKIDFISPMANALRQTGAETTRAIFMDVANMYQATQNMEIFDKLDLDQIIDELATGLGAPAAVIRSDEEVAKIRRQRAEAQAEQARQAMQMQALAAQNQAPNQAPNQAGPQGAQGVTDAGPLGEPA